ncbi:MAG: T9SS type A sorting domain-containing protein [Bacteroidota bacterium]
MLLRTYFSALLCGIGLVLSAQVTADFADGTTQGWVNGSNAQNPVLISDGGPAGAGDAYLRITADGSGPGGKLAIFNVDSTWTGNFLAKQVRAIELSARNLSDQELTIRLAIDDANRAGLVTDTALVLAANDTTWQTLEFPLGEDDLVGDADYQAVLANVTKVWIFHGGTAFPGPEIEAQVGVDDVELITASTNTAAYGPEVSQLRPLAQPAPQGQAALVVEWNQPGEFRATVFDLRGRAVTSRAGMIRATGEQRIELFDLQRGEYVIRFVHSGAFGRSLRSQRLLVR